MTKTSDTPTSETISGTALALKQGKTIGEVIAYWEQRSKRAERDRAELIEALRLCAYNLDGIMRDDDLPSVVIRDKARALLERMKEPT